MVVVLWSVFFCKQKTAYEICIGDWSSDVCSSDLLGGEFLPMINEGDLLYMPSALPGLSAAKASELLQQTDRLIKTVPEVERSEERRVGKECVSTCRSGRSLYH